MHWTTDPPTTPGFYFMKWGEAIEIGVVIKMDGELQISFDGRQSYAPVSAYDKTQWAGPLDPPQG